MSIFWAAAKGPGMNTAAARTAAAADPKKLARTVMPAPVLRFESQSRLGALAAALIHRCAIPAGVVRIDPDRGEGIRVDVEHLTVVGRGGVARRSEIGLSVG